MRWRKPLTDDMLRILQLAAGDDLRLKETGRWKSISGADLRGTSRDRKLLVQRGYAVGELLSNGERTLLLTDLGREALRAAGLSE